MARSASQEEVFIWKVREVPEGPNMGWAGVMGTPWEHSLPEKKLFFGQVKK